MRFDKFNPMIEGLIQSVELAIKAEDDEKAELLKLPDSQFLAQTAGACFLLVGLPRIQLRSAIPD